MPTLRDGFKRGAWFYQYEPERWVTRENYITGRDVRLYASTLNALGETLTRHNVRALYGRALRNGHALAS